MGPSAPAAGASELVQGCALVDCGPMATNEQPERLSAEEVRRVATLCHVGVSDDEVEQLRGEMAKLVAEISVLQATMSILRVNCPQYRATRIYGPGISSRIMRR